MNNPILNMFGNFQNFQSQFNQFANNFNPQNGLSPKQIVQSKLDSGEMTQEQFNQFSAIANQITGRNN